MDIYMFKKLVMIPTTHYTQKSTPGMFLTVERKSFQKKILATAFMNFRKIKIS